MCMICQNTGRMCMVQDGQHSGDYTSPDDSCDRGEPSDPVDLYEKKKG